jgi:hypothetical protein
MVTNIHRGVMRKMVVRNDNNKKNRKWNPFILSYIKEPIKGSTFSSIKDAKSILVLAYIDFLQIRHTSLCLSHSS